jgi:hypothetical protein
MKYVVDAYGKQRQTKSSKRVQLGYQLRPVVVTDILNPPTYIRQCGLLALKKQHAWSIAKSAAHVCGRLLLPEEELKVRVRSDCSLDADVQRVLLLRDALGKLGGGEINQFEQGRVNDSLI